MKRMLLALTLASAACSGPSSGTETSTSHAPPSTQQSAISTTSLPQAAPAAVGSREIPIPTSDIDLAGTLWIPAAEGRVPGVVLIHGSGPQSRDSVLPGQLNMAFGFEIPVFAELAGALQDNGIAVLTYDKRSCGPFNGCADNGYPFPDADLVVDTFIDDAHAAVAALRQQPEVDPDQIAVIGHSQGAQFITLMLETDPRLAAGVMVAGPYRPIDEIMHAQLDFTVDLLGQLGVAEADALASPGVVPLVEMVDGVAGIRAGGDDPVGGVSATFWRSWLDLHERSLSAAFRIAQPLLILNGKTDWNIPVAEAAAWAEFLARVGADFDVVTLPCVTHALNCVTGDDPLAISPNDIGRHVAPEVIDAVVTFLTG